MHKSHAWSPHQRTCNLNIFTMNCKDVVSIIIASRVQLWVYGKQKLKGCAAIITNLRCGVYDCTCLACLKGGQSMPWMVLLYAQRHNKALTSESTTTVASPFTLIHVYGSCPQGFPAMPFTLFTVCATLITCTLVNYQCQESNTKVKVLIYVLWHCTSNYAVTTEN